jgi:transposase
MFVGIDGSKERLDVHLRPSAETFTVARDGQGLEQLVARLATVGPELVVLEATGGFEITVAAAVAAAGLPLAVVNPARSAPSRAPSAAWPRPTGWMPS